MAIARTEGGIEVEWTSSSVPVEQLDAALNRGVYELIESDEQDVLGPEQQTNAAGRVLR